MPINSYECLFLLDPTKTSTDLEGVRGQLHATLDKYGAEILASRKWDDRRLSYPINGHKKALYYLTFFRLDATKMVEVEHDFRLNETIVRHMVTHVEPKWEEELLAVAKDDHRFAVQAMREEAPEPTAANLDGPPMDGVPADMGDGPRRGPRRSAEAEVGKE